VRLLFEAAGVAYCEVFDPPTIMAGCDLANIGSGFPYPAKAPPIVLGPDGFNCSQTPAILHALGKKFGLFPDEDDEANCLALNITAADFIAEGRLAFHAHAPVGSYSIQIEETKPRIEWFVSERLPKWLNHFEHCFQVTSDRGASYLFSGKLTYCDIAIFHVLNATEAQFSDAWASLSPSYPLLVAFKARMMDLPNIKEYYASSRVKPWAGDSMM
jgi:glutathione S-transferase